MFTHSRCKFCRTLLQTPNTPRNAFCTPSCKRLYAVHGTINSMVINPYRDAILDNELQSIGTGGTVEFEPRAKHPAFAGERQGDQYTLNLFGEVDNKTVQNRPGRKRTK